MAEVTKSASMSAMPSVDGDGITKTQQRRQMGFIAV